MRFRLYTAVFLFSILLILLLSSCQNKEVVLTIQNESSDVCNSIKIKKATASDWGLEELDSDLDINESTTIILDKEIYDFWMIFNASEDATYKDVDLTSFDIYKFNIKD
ncbi:hypothetical protein [Spirochaeta isovalerica]|uniref:Lipoprotein n=1 Tax=Spirochaeta isovalerica TaxID=150 RepID=A0A841RDQ0_9SPIO|nr:hypothetical protein [Spirochaeta isovalerica]MBB6481511.1 hypothetical protein [Spirochaeta isovalerica]